MKSLKKKSGQATSKKYLYHDNLQFLLKVVQKDDTDSSIQESQQIVDPEDGEDMGIEEEAWDGATCSATEQQSRNPRKRRRLQDDVDREILQALSSSKATPDEDEAFFISITPHVQRMSADDKLDFRMGVMQLVNDITSRGIPANHPAFPCLFLITFP